MSDPTFSVVQHSEKHIQCTLPGIPNCMLNSLILQHHKFQATKHS